jgi:hypothetical protein
VSRQAQVLAGRLKLLAKRYFVMLALGLRNIHELINIKLKAVYRGDDVLYNDSSIKHKIGANA